MNNENINDYYLLHYSYYFANGTQKGEGNLYVATTHGTGVRLANIEGALEQARLGLEDKLQVPVIVVIQNVAYLSSCTEDEFKAPQTQSNEA